MQANLLLRGWQDDPEVCSSFVAKNTPLPEFLEHISYIRTAVRFPFYLSALWKQLRNAEIAHIFSAAGTSFLISTVPAYWIARILGKKTIIHYHSSLAESHLHGSSLARTALQNVDGVVVPSEYLANVFHTFHIAAKIVPNLIDPRQFAYRERRPLSPFLLCTRNLESRYGIDLVVRAFGKVQNEFPDARLCLAGTGPEEGSIRRLVAELNLHHIEMPGRIPHEEIGRLYDRSDIFVNASRVDNMPVSIMEAFASGMPVATTNAGGTSLIVEHERTGLLCETEDWQALAANVIRLLRDPALATRIANHALLQSESYGWHAIREQWLKVYSGLNLTGTS